MNAVVWMFVLLPKFICWTPSKKMVLGGGPYGRWSGLEGRALKIRLMPL